MCRGCLYEQFAKLFEHSPRLKFADVACMAADRLAIPAKDFTTLFAGRGGGLSYTGSSLVVLLPSRPGFWENIVA